jgi:hypothetical protein
VAAAGERGIEARLAEAVPVRLDEVEGSRLGRWWEERVGRFAGWLARWVGRLLARR